MPETSRTVTHHTTSSPSLTACYGSLTDSKQGIAKPPVMRRQVPAFLPIGAQIFTISGTCQQIKQWPIITYETPICDGLEHPLRSTSIGVTTHAVATCRSLIPVPNLMKDTRYIFHEANIRVRNVKVLIWLYDFILWITNELFLPQYLPYRTDRTNMWPPVPVLSSLSFTLQWKKRPFQGPLFLQCPPPTPPPLHSFSYCFPYTSDTTLSLQSYHLSAIALLS